MRIRDCIGEFRKTVNSWSIVINHDLENMSHCVWVNELAGEVIFNNGVCTF